MANDRVVPFNKLKRTKSTVDSLVCYEERKQQYDLYSKFCINLV